MTVMPAEYVAAPPSTPAAYGLLSAAVVTESTGRVGFGFEYEPDFCGPARATVAACQTGASKVVDEGKDLVVGEPFTVYSLHSCKAVAFGDAAQRAQRALTTGEGRAVEEWFAARLAAEAVSIGAWTGVDKALAALEHYIHCNYGGVGTIHMDRAHASLLFSKGDALDTSGTRLTTGLGNIVSAGCYDDTDPLGPSTMYATGTVLLQRGSVFSPPDPLLDKATNDLFALAERPYAGGWECFAVSVGVTP